MSKLLNWGKNNILKILKIIGFSLAQLIVVIGLTYLFQHALEVIPIPDVLKNMSIIELNDLDDGIIQQGSEFKYAIESTQLPDSNVIIVNTVNSSPYQIRGKIAKSINFLKKNEVKVIGLDFILDWENAEKPADDTALVKAMKDAGNVIVINNVLPGVKQFDTTALFDTSLTLQPVPLFMDGIKGLGYQNLEWAKDDQTKKVVKFYPNINFYGELLRSFPLELAYQFDSSKASILKGKIEKEGLNYPDKSKLTIYNIDTLLDDTGNDTIEPHLKGKIVLIGYITPEEDQNKSQTYVTPIGRIDFVVMYAGIVSDILLKKFVPSSPDEVDYMVGAIFGIVNLFLFSYASRKSVALQKFCNGWLIPVEIIVAYLMVMVGFILFDYKLSVAIPAIVSMVSVPLNGLIRNTINPAYKRMVVKYKFRKYPYPLVHNFMTSLESSKRAIRHLSLFHSFYRTFLMMRAFSYAGLDKIDKMESNKIKDWAKLKEHIEKSNNNILNERLLKAINKVSKLSSLNSFISSSHSSIFEMDNMRKEIFVRIEEERDIDPKLDIFGKYNPILSRLIDNLSQEFLGYKMIYIIKRHPENYLVLFFDSNTPQPNYLKSEIELKEREVYLVSPDMKEYISLSPFIVFRMCKYHKKKELFVFAEKNFNETTGEEKSSYMGEYFTCSLIFSPKI